MKLLYVFCFLMAGILAHSQKLIKGVILDAEKNKPISNASIFLNNTSIGTTSDAQGNFFLTVPNGRFDLIASSVGYETFNQTMNSNELSDFLTIKLKLKSELMQTVVVAPYEKDGWEKWGKFFLDNFIGTSAYSKECKITNTKVILFRNNKKTNELSVDADEPLIIENRALGYVLQYQLESFTYNFKSHYLVFTGYPFFQQMKGSAGKKRKWEKKRNEAYFGSMLHFMRSIYRNTIVQEGFEVRAVQKIPNTEKQRVKQAYQLNLKKTKTADGRLVVTQIDKDSSDYYDRIMRQEDYIDVIGSTTLTGDSIAYAVNNTTAGLDFKNYLLVIYKNKFAPAEYHQQFPKNSTAMQSQIVLINEKPVEVEASGSYYNPSDLMTLGYWSWSEKIASMLPFDYSQPKH